MYCDSCKLDCKYRSPVFPSGPITPDIYILGDYSDSSDIEHKIVYNPYAQKGMYLHNVLRSLGLDTKCRIFNNIRCDISNQYQDYKDIYKYCSEYAKIDIYKTNPKVIITLGADSAKLLLGSQFDTLSNMHGKLMTAEIKGKKFKVVPTYSLSYILKEFTDSEKFINDFRFAKSFIEGKLVDISSKKLEVARNYEEFIEYYNKNLKDKDFISYDIETNAMDPRSEDAEIVGFSLAPSGMTGIYISRRTLDYSMPEDDWNKITKFVVENIISKHKILVHNCMYEIPFTLNKWNYYITNFEDSLIKARLVLGGTIGAGLKEQCIKQLNYPDWDKDLGNYLSSMKALINGLKPTSSGKLRDEYNVLKDNSLVELSNYEFTSSNKRIDSISSSSKLILRVLNKYYSGNELSDIIDKVSKEIIRLVDIDFTGMLSYGVVPSKIIARYGAMDAVATQDLNKFLDQRIDELSDELKINLHNGYKYLKQHFVAGTWMELNGMNWNDEVATQEYNWYNNKCIECAMSMINSHFLDEYLFQNTQSEYNQYLVDNKLDELIDVFGNFKVTKSGIKPEGGKLIRFKNILSELGQDYINSHRDDIISLARLNASKIHDNYKNLKKYFNPASPTKENKEFLSNIFVTDETKVARIIQKLQVLIDDPSVDKSAYSHEHELLRVLTDYASYNKFVDEYNSSEDKGEYLRDNLSKLKYNMYYVDNTSEYKKLTNKDRFDKFVEVLSKSHIVSKDIEKIVIDSYRYKMESVSELDLIEINELYVISGVDVDNPDTWLDSYRFLVNFRLWKKCNKIITSYIEGDRVGRGSVYIVDKASYKNGDTITRRKRLYDGTPKSDEMCVMQSKFGVCTAESYRWRSGLHCLKGDTKIILCDGRELEVSKLCKEFNDGIDNYTYSLKKCDNGKYTYIVDKIRDVYISYYSHSMVKVTLDNGNYFEVTPDHKMVLRNGSYIEAQNLSVGDSLYPFYTKLDSKLYLQIIDVDNNQKLLYAHHLAYDYNVRNNLERDISNDDLGNNGSWVRHHIDFNKSNNNPTNVNRYGYTTHMNIHSHSSEGHKSQWETQKLKMSINSEYRNRRLSYLQNNGRTSMKKLWKSDEFRKSHAVVSGNVFKRINKDSKVKKLQKHNRIASYIRKLYLLDNNLSEKSFNHTRSKYIRSTSDKSAYKLDTVVKEYGSLEEAIEYAKLYNHKVVKIERVTYKEGIPVYSVSINPDNPTFPLACGVMSKNTLPMGVSVRHIYTSRYDGGVIAAPDFCLAGDTRIRLANGTSPKIKDLVGVDEFYVYSYDEKSRRIKIGRGHDARLVRYANDMYRVTLENGDTIDCTSNHKFFDMRSERMKEAKDFVVGDSILPIRFSKYNAHGVYNKGRECILDPWDSHQELTHYLADEYNLKIGKYTESSGTDRHHIDMNKLNNDPRNIIRVTRSEHMFIHSKDRSSDPSYIEGLRSRARTQWTNQSYRDKMHQVSLTKGKESLLISNSDPHSIRLRKIAKRMKSMNKLHNALVCMQVKGIVPSPHTWNDCLSQIDHPRGCKSRAITHIYGDFAKFIYVESEIYDYPKEYIDAITAKLYFENRTNNRTLSTIKRCYDNARKLGLSLSDSLEWDRAIDHLRKSNIIGKFDGISSAKLLQIFKSFDNVNKYCMNNHKIAKIEKLSDTNVPVYCFTVDEYHNFFLDCGVLSSNSQMELRTMAGAANCEPMMEAFRNGADIHRENAAKIFRKDPKEISHEERRYSKMACTVGSTKIKLANGKISSIEDIYNSGLREFYVYSFDLSRNKIVPGLVRNVELVKSTCNLVRVTLSNGKHIDTTYDHLYLLQSGKYVRASELNVGDRLETLFYRVPTKGAYSYSTKHPNYYEQIRDVRYKYYAGSKDHSLHARYGKWRMTHIEFYKEYFGNSDNTISGIANIDHIDHNSLNNSIENLQIVSQADNMTSGYNKSSTDRFGILAQASNVVKMLLKERLELTESNFDQMMAHMYEGNGHLYWKTASRYYTFHDICQSIMTRANYKVSGEKLVDYSTLKKFKLNEIAGLDVAKVEFLDLKEPVNVYELSVDNYHNYAIDLGDNTGVFTHNSFMILYGGDYKNFSKEFLGGDETLGKYIYDSFYSAYPQIEDYIKSKHEEARTKGKVTTLMDMFMYCTPSMYQGDVNRQMRVAQNSVIQSLSYDTKIIGLDGKSHMIKDLADTNSDLEVLSYDTESGKVIPTKGINAQCTGYTDTWYKLTLDNGKSVKVTPEHKMMLRDGTYCEARNLVVGQSLMPLYMNNHRGYLKDESSGQFIHRLVYDSHYVGHNRLSVHHINFDKYDNRLYNLVGLTNAEHIKYHRLVSEYAYSLDEHKREELENWLMPIILKRYEFNVEDIYGIVNSIKEFHNRIVSDRDLRLMLTKKSMSYRNQHKSESWSHNQKAAVSASGKSRIATYGNIACMPKEEYSKMVKDNWVKYRSTYVEALKIAHASDLARMNHSVASVARESNPDYVFNRVKKQLLDRYEKGIDWSNPNVWDATAVYYPGPARRYSWYITKHMTWDEFVDRGTELVRYHNHKIAKIEVIKLDTPEPKYDLHIPKYENFALECGVFTHNSASSMIAGCCLYKIMEYIWSHKMKTKIILFVHDSVEVDIPPEELIEIGSQIIPIMSKFPNEQFHMPVKADLVLGGSLGKEVEVHSIEHNDDYSEGILDLEGYQDEVDELIELWKPHFRIVEATQIGEVESEYKSWSQLWIPKLAIQKGYGTYRYKVHMKVRLVK